MVHKNELRLGNMVYVDGHRNLIFRITQLKTNVAFVKNKWALQIEYEMLAPVTLSASLLESCGFEVTGESNLGPDFTGYRLPIPALGDVKNDIFAVVHQDDEYEAFAILRINGHHAGNRLLHMHRLQNIYHDLTGEELKTHGL